MTHAPPVADDLARSTAVHVGAVGSALAAALGFSAGRVALDGERLAFVVLALACYALVAVWVLVNSPRHAPYHRFGAANAVTLARAGMVCFLAGLIVCGPRLAQYWAPFGLSLAALALDGVDGWTARRLRLQSDFGAVFDMETDAFHILVLSALAYNGDKAGAWVFASGLLRYLFILAGSAAPLLRTPLPYSQRRRSIAMLQTAALVVCLMPVVAPPYSTACAAFGLLLLLYSFAVDLVWIFRSR